jgi:hypothetical protein
MSCWYNHFWLSDLPFYFILEFCFRWHAQLRNKKEWKAIFLICNLSIWSVICCSKHIFDKDLWFPLVSLNWFVYLCMYLNVYLSVFLSFSRSIYLYVHKHSIMGPMEENPVMGKFADVFISGYQIGKHCFLNIITQNGKKSQNGFLSLRFFSYIMCW